MEPQRSNQEKALRDLAGVHRFLSKMELSSEVGLNWATRRSPSETCLWVNRACHGVFFSRGTQSTKLTPQPVELYLARGSHIEAVYLTRGSSLRESAHSRKKSDNVSHAGVKSQNLSSALAHHVRGM